MGITIWLEHVKEWSNCQRCPLAQQRSQVCLARSEWPDGAQAPNLRLPCDVLFVGEAPGMSEDALGFPFVGPAGKLLDDIVANALPQGVYVAMTNLVVCYPRLAKERGDNEPERGEVLECRPRLVEFVNLAQPRLIVRVGRMAVQYLNFDYKVPYADIDHPAHIIRMPLAQRQMAAQRCIVHLRNAWDDVLECNGATKEPWKEWGEKNAEAKTSKREQIKREYEEVQNWKD